MGDPVRARGLDASLIGNEALALSEFKALAGAAAEGTVFFLPVVDKSRPEAVNPLNNFYFTTASSFLIMALGWFLTDKVIEPRLKHTPVDGDASEMPSMDALNPRERKGLGLALLAMLVAVVLLVVTALPAGSPWRVPLGAEANAGELLVSAAPAAPTPPSCASTPSRPAWTARGAWTSCRTAER